MPCKKLYKSRDSQAYSTNAFYGISMRCVNALTHGLGTSARMCGLYLTSGLVDGIDMCYGLEHFEHTPYFLENFAKKM
jgi:hypothetical protein